MTTDIAGLPFWELTFDAGGDSDSARMDRILTDVRDRNITDLIVFSHGWNNNQRIATELYTAFFGILADQLVHVPADRPVTVGLAGVIWPSQLWSDQPIPDFPSAQSPGGTGGTGAASLEFTTPNDPNTASDPTLDEQTLTDLHNVFPAATEPLDKMAALLGAAPTAEAQAQFYDQLKEFNRLAGVTSGDGEQEPTEDPAVPRMFENDVPTELFGRYTDALQHLGVPLTEPAGGQASIGDSIRGIWNGAKEALRGTTYWQMKNRAGVVGQAGLGPLIGRLHQSRPEVRVHLVGHSFGARLVSYALAGLPDSAEPSPVKAVTLLQGAFSHFTFAQPLPFDATRNGALAGKLSRIDGPLTVCFSTHDSAVGTMYPLASLAAREDAAGADDALYRWGAMGADGAQGVDAQLASIQPGGPGTHYPYTPGHALNVDASEVVCSGGPPSGAHSDILHAELTWIILSAGRILS